MLSWRRDFLAGLLGSAALTRAMSQAGEVDSFELFPVRVNHRGNWLLLRLKTSKGITGLGDASHAQPDSRTMELIQEYFGWIRGRSPFEVEAYRAALMAKAGEARRPGAVAFSAIEQCLHDIQGKALGVPCWALFGGKLRLRIEHYANINRATVDRRPEGFAALAEPAMKAGFSAIKMAPFDGLPKDDAARRAAAIQLGIDCVAAVRQTIGPNRRLLVDGHSNFNLEEGLDVTRRLEPFQLWWWEEVVPGIDNLARINKASSIPTAGGESLYGIHQFYPYIRGEAVDIVMPDVKYCGGMLELKKISAMAEGAGLTSAPHGPASPVGNVAAAQVCATLNNFLILELGFGEVPWRPDLITPPESFDQGHLLLSSRPGLGIDLNIPVARRHAA
jgi:galactonate dehydratase